MPAIKKQTESVGIAIDLFAVTTLNLQTPKISERELRMFTLALNSGLMKGEITKLKVELAAFQTVSTRKG